MSNLQELRKQKGLSQSELSKLSGVNLRTIQCYEIEQRDINGACLDILCKIAYALNCKLSDLLTDEELIQRIEKII